MTEVVVMEGDILWRSEFNQPENDYRNYRETWLRVCKNISQGGRPVVLCGCSIPSQFENCIERRYFTDLYYLALVCDDDSLIRRLIGRPSWRKSDSDEHIKAHVQFNHWFKNNTEKITPKITLLDTSSEPSEATVEKVRKWILEKI